jgi:hypothetical protein
VRLSWIVLASLLPLASSAAADSPSVEHLFPKLRLEETLRLERPPDAPDVELPSVWTRLARSLPAASLDDCDVEVESDLSFVRFSLSGKF